MSESDPHYPTINTEAIIDLILESGKVVKEVSVGATRAFLLEGKKPVFKRTIYIRPTEDNVIHYERAVGIAAKVNGLGSLLAWYEANCQWKDGAYTVGAESAPKAPVARKK